jgi:hypothetical protein
MKTYNYFTFGAIDAYGQPGLSDEPAGQVKMAINISSQSVVDNINYKDATYTGLTLAKVDDSYVIEYGNERLKVLYVNPMGRYKQVFLKEI